MYACHDRADVLDEGIYVSLVPLPLGGAGTAFARVLELIYEIQRGLRVLSLLCNSHPERPCETKLKLLA